MLQNNGRLLVGFSSPFFFFSKEFRVLLPAARRWNPDSYRSFPNDKISTLLTG